jgi:hypothetical protein
MEMDGSQDLCTVCHVLPPKHPIGGTLRHGMTYTVPGAEKYEQHTAAASSLIHSAEPNRRASSCRPFPATPIRVFLGKIAALFYNTLRHGVTYKDPGAEQYEQQYRSRVLANLQRRSKSLGFILQAIPSDANPAVS